MNKFYNIFLTDKKLCINLQDLLDRVKKNFILTTNHLHKQEQFHLLQL